MVNDDIQSNIEEIEIDGMVSYINKKDYIWIWKALIITLENLLVGNVVIAVPKP